MNKTIKGILFTLLSGICWGLSGVAGESLMKSGDISSSWLVPVRLLSSGVILMLYMIPTKKKQIFDIFKNKRDIIDLLIYAICGIMLCQYTYFFTIQHSNAGTATILQYVAPVLVMVVTCVGSKRFPRGIEIVCVAMAMTGVFVIATHGNINTLAISPKALTVGLISAITVVVYSLQPVRLMKKYSPFYLLAWSFTIGGIILAVVFRLWRYTPELNLVRIGLVAVTAIPGSILGYGLYLQGVKRIGGAKACLIGSAEPVSAALFSSLFLGTDFTRHDIAGFVLIIVTVVVLSFEKEKI